VGLVEGRSVGHLAGVLEQSADAGLVVSRDAGGQPPGEGQQLLVAEGGVSPVTSLRSTPAQNAGSAPVRITAATPGSSPAAATASHKP
jgi:hypothetical protein